MYRVAIITVSDKGYRGERFDASGQVIRAIVESHGYRVAWSGILPDERELISAQLQSLCDRREADLILTTGGTGLAKRDITPEATLAVLERLCPGIPEAMRGYSLTLTSRAMLSRAVAGIRGETLIVNLPGSPKAVRECLEYIIEALGHGLDILSGESAECAR